MGRARRKVPWLEQRGDVFYAMWYDGTTRRRSLHTSDPSEARIKFAEFLAGGHDILRGGRQLITVRGALDDYRREHLSAGVVDRDRAGYAIARLVEFFGAKPLIEVDIPACRAYAAYRRAHPGVDRNSPRRPPGDSTIRRELGVLQAAASHAARWRRIGPSADPPTPMPSIERPSETPAREEWLTREELDRVVTNARGKLADFILIAYYTGARRASVENLTRFQVDLRHGWINLTHASETPVQRRSKKRRPVVPIDPRVRPVVERLLAETEARNGEHLFAGNRDFYWQFRKLFQSLGLGAKAYPHILRHSRATHLLQDGVSIYDVARLLGDTVATVEKAYGHHSADHLAAAIGVATR